jgi:hypothetical protein
MCALAGHHFWPVLSQSGIILGFHCDWLFIQKASVRPMILVPGQQLEYNWLFNEKASVRRWLLKIMIGRELLCQFYVGKSNSWEKPASDAGF